MTSARARKPRVGFLGVGWIGLSRMKAVAQSELVDICAFADDRPEAREAALALAPAAQACRGLSELLEQELDGVVIATPSALHAEQASAALERKVAVFCQKPLGRSGDEAERVVRAAAQADRLLGVDFCYRDTQAMQRLKEVVSSGELGRVYSARLVFHNAYGPDKRWYYERALSGGGCVMDLGIHLVDAALWLLDFPRTEAVRSRLYAGGELLPLPPRENEDYALAQLELAGGVTVDMACSWNLPAGCDAFIQVELFGTQGGVRFENVNGSFYEFRADRLHKTERRELAAPPDDWGGRTVVQWARALGQGGRFDPAALRYVDSARLLDRIYGHAEG